MEPLELENKSIEELLEMDKEEYDLYSKVTEISKNVVQNIFDKYLGKGIIEVRSEMETRLNFIVPGNPYSLFSSHIDAIFRVDDPIDIYVKPRLEVYLRETFWTFNLGDNMEETKIQDNQKIVKMADAFMNNTAMVEDLSNHLKVVFSLLRVLADRIKRIRKEMDR